MEPPRVLLADDHTLLLGALEQLLTPEFQVVGQVSDGRELVAAAVKLKPDVIVVDIAMPLLNGLEAARQIKRADRNVKLIFLTMYENAELAAEAFNAGASGYLLKRSVVSELVTAIREVMMGRSYVTPLVTAGLLTSMLHLGEHKPSHELTPRQREVLQLLAEGHSMKAIASMLNVKPGTIAFHKYTMMENLGIKSTAELVRYAAKHHLV
jgi:DNA-binding NarL/FixJ family response regulator